MGIGALIKGLFSKEPSPNAVSEKQSYRDLRMHARVRPNIRSVMYAQIGAGSGGVHAEIIDISYGGFALSVDPARSSEVMNATQATIFVGNTECHVSVKYLHRRGNVCGYSFSHEAPDALIYLREPIEMMKRGSSLMKVPHAGEKSESSAFNSTYWRGEGPTDLKLVRTSGSGELSEMHLSSREGRNYYCITFKDGAITQSETKQEESAKPHKQNDNMQASRGMDQATMKKVLLILNGVEDQELLELTGTFRHALLNQLGIGPKLIRAAK
jgi:hypothetical protein